MRVSRDEKARSRERIVASASRRLREAGIGGASVADVMRDAGLTHGGFYRHFPDKAALVAAAVAHGFDEFAGGLAARVAGGEAEAAAADFIDRYLSDGHVANPGLGCPAAAAGADVARGDDSARAAFGTGVEQVVTALAATMKGPHRRARAQRRFAMLVGAVVLARASDPATAAAVLAAARGAD